MLPLFRVVLIDPEIPQNTGNIGRTCVGTQCELHLVGQLGFHITDKNVKRAGLDYWPHLKWFQHKDYDQWLHHAVPASQHSRAFYFSTKAEKTLFDVEFQQGDWLVFGRETKGLPAEIIEANKDQLIKIPQLGPVRSLNLATAVAIAVYEGMRQLRYKNS